MRSIINIHENETENQGLKDVKDLAMILNDRPISIKS